MLKEEIASTKKQLTMLENDCKQSLYQLKKKQKEFEALEAQHKELSHKICEIENLQLLKAEQVNKILSEKEKEISSLKDSARAALEKENGLLREIESLEEDSRNKIQGLQSEKTKLESMISERAKSLELKISSLERELCVEKKEKERRCAEIDLLNKKIQTLDSELSRQMSIDRYTKKNAFA